MLKHAVYFIFVQSKIKIEKLKMSGSQKMSVQKMIQVAGLVCLSALFIYQAVVILKEPEKNADKLFK